MKSYRSSNVTRSVSVRYPAEVVEYVKSKAKKMGLEDSEMWRLIVEKGIESIEEHDTVLNNILKVSVQSLCLNRRLAGNADTELVVAAQEDAKSILRKIADTKVL